MILLSSLQTKNSSLYFVGIKFYILCPGIVSSLPSHAKWFKIGQCVGCLDNCIIIYFGICGSPIGSCHPCRWNIGCYTVVEEPATKTNCTSANIKGSSSCL